MTLPRAQQEAQRVRNLAIWNDVICYHVTLKKAGERYGVSYERVRQICARISRERGYSDWLSIPKTRIAVNSLEPL